jgi:hypothetical protein
MLDMSATARRHGLPSECGGRRRTGNRWKNTPMSGFGHDRRGTRSACLSTHSAQVLHGAGKGFPHGGLPDPPGAAPAEPAGRHGKAHGTARHGASRQATARHGAGAATRRARRRVVGPVASGHPARDHCGRTRAPDTVRSRTSCGGARQGTSGRTPLGSVSTTRTRCE